MNSPLISVIVPVYNTEAYICKCIDSIINQTYKNLEIFIIDDGSTDNCPIICDEYSRLDHRVKVIHRENGGLSIARNMGLDIATGEYITFVDSDDCLISNNVISNCIDKIADEDIVIIGDFDLRYDKMVLKGVELLYAFTNELYISGPWSKLFKRKLFFEHSIRFNEHIVHEDEEILPKLFYYANDVLLLKQQFYLVFQRPNSLTRNQSEYSCYKRAKGRILGAFEVIKFFEDKKIKFATRRGLYRRYFGFYFAGTYLTSKKITDSDLLHQLMTLIQNTKHILKYSFVTFNLKYMLLYLFLNIFSVNHVLRIINKIK